MIKKEDSMKNIVEVIKKFRINRHKKAIGFKFIINLIIVIGAGAILFGLIWAIMSGSL